MYIYINVSTNINKEEKSMKINSYKIMMVCFVALIFTFMVSPAVSAETEETFAKNGFYIGLNIPYNSIKGDFNDDSAITSLSTGEVISIPKVQNDYGLGITFGYRDSSLAYELSYLASTHDMKLKGVDGEADYSMVSLDIKRYFEENNPTQPFLLIGLCIPELVINEGATVGLQTGDATLDGIGLNIGGGISHYVSPQFFVHAAIIYRFINYTDAEGITTSGSIDADDYINGSGLNFNVGVAYTF
jgi:hypothetical protein